MKLGFGFGFFTINVPVREVSYIDVGHLTYYYTMIHRHDHKFIRHQKYWF